MPFSLYISYMDISKASQIATEILQQLGNGRFKVMTGAKHFSALSTKQGVEGGLREAELILQSLGE